MICFWILLGELALWRVFGSYRHHSCHCIWKSYVTRFTVSIVSAKAVQNPYFLWGDYADVGQLLSCKHCKQSNFSIFSFSHWGSSSFASQNLKYMKAPLAGSCRWLECCGIVLRSANCNWFSFELKRVWGGPRQVYTFKLISVLCQYISVDIHIMNPIPVIVYTPKKPWFNREFSHMCRSFRGCFLS